MSQTETQTHTSLDDDLSFLDPPAQPNVGTAVRRYPIIVLVSVVACLLAGAAFGLARKPNYTANVTLQVGSIDLKLPGAIGGLQTANEELATAYSREAQASPIIGAVSKQLHLPQTTILAALSSSPVPLSGNFTITAVSQSRAQAIAIANAASDALARYVNGANNNTAYVNKLWGEYQAAAAQVSAAQTATMSARQAIGLMKGHPTSAQLKALTKAQADVDTSSTNREAIQQAYFAAKSQETNAPQIVTPAVLASSDKKTKLAIALFGALVGGLLIGGALATLWARRRATRARALARG
jgi:uncharacterized protein involved in exopolysaccharide biosynthesis